MHFGNAGGMVLIVWKINLKKPPQAVTFVGGSTKKAKKCKA